MGRDPGGRADAGRGRNREDRAAYQRPGGRPGYQPCHATAAPVPDHEPAVGRGKVAKFQLQEKAEALGAEVALLEGPGTVDVAVLARKAVADGADLLGVAGGDGTQALVAGTAADTTCPSW